VPGDKTAKLMSFPKLALTFCSAAGGLVAGHDRGDRALRPLKSVANSGLSKAVGEERQCSPSQRGPNPVAQDTLNSFWTPRC